MLFVDVAGKGMLACAPMKPPGLFPKCWLKASSLSFWAAVLVVAWAAASTVTALGAPHEKRNSQAPALDWETVTNQVMRAFENKDYAAVHELLKSAGAQAAHEH